MRMLSLALSFMAAFGMDGLAAAGAATKPVSNAPDPLRLGNTVMPLSQSVTLDLDADRTDYTGSTLIELDVREQVASFRFHAADMELRSLTLVGPSGPIAATHARGDQIGLVTVTPAKPLARGRYALTIEFTNAFGLRAVGLYKVTADNRNYAFTQFEADDAREAFPCWDEPGFKIPFTMTINVPEAHQVVFNTPVKSEAVAAGRRSVQFATTKPLPTYLLCIATGPLEFVDLPGLGIPARVVVPHGQTSLTHFPIEMTPPILAAVEKWFGEPYPFEKLDLIAVPDYWAGAMENPGAITFTAAAILLDPKTASVAQRRTLSGFIAHELAHMWFGDKVTMAWWDDLWLNESFADWLGDRISHQVHPEFDRDIIEMQPIQNTMQNDARPSSKPIHGHVSAGDNLMENVGTQYNKGKMVLGMFEQWMGPEKFQKGVRQYLAEHAWGNATADDLWKSLAAASGPEFTGAMKTFLDQPGLPLVSAELGANGRVTLRQQRFLNHGVEAPAQTWRIPIVLRYADAHDVKTQSVLLEDAERTVQLRAHGEVAWVLPNADARGFYRWRVTPEQLTALSTGARALMTPRERIGLVHNMTALLNSGGIHGDDYLRSLQAFGSDPEPLVVAAVAGALGGIRTAFVPESAEHAFAAYVQRTLGPALERFGIDKQVGEKETTAGVRATLMDWLGDEGRDERVLSHAQKQAQEYLADPTTVDPSLASVVVKLAAHRGNRPLYDTYRSRFESARIPAERTRFLAAMGNFRDPAILEDALAYAVTGPLRPQELFVVLQGLGETAPGRDRCWTWMTTNFDVLSKRLPPESVGFMPFFASGCEAERVAAAREFFGEPAHQAPGTSTSIARVSDAVGDCVRLREREGAAAVAFLHEQVGSR